MTNIVKSASDQKLPANEAEVSKMLRPKVIGFVLLIVLVLLFMSGGVPFLTFKLDWGANSAPAMVLDFISGLLIMAVFYYGSSRLAGTLLGYGRNFVEHSQWSDAEDVLSQFNQWGMHFLDPTGEAHYLLATALAKRGKYETAKKAREFILKSRAGSEWASKLQPQESPRKQTASGDDRPQEKAPKPSKAKRRRY